MFKLYTDAATNNNSDSAGGILIIHNKQQEQIKIKIHSNDNHHAEFEACLAGFQKLAQLATRNDIIVYYTDSKIVHDSLIKHYAKHYQQYVDLILQEQNRYQMVLNNWIADTKNEGAHNLAIQGLHYFY